MFRFTIATCVFLIAITLMYPAAGIARVGIRQEGSWPETWPEELEVYRKQAKTLEVAHGKQENIYEIHFRNGREFERIWPAILKVKSKGAPVTLLSVSPKQEGSLFDSEKPMVRIYCPAYNSGRIRSLGKLSGAEPPWPDSIRSFTGQLPEYVEQAKGGDWIPEQERIPTSFKYRARIDIELVVDGQIIDLDRIHIPADVPIVDKRKHSGEGSGASDIESLVAWIGTATLSKAGEEMSHKWMLAARTPAGEIHTKLWSAEIRKLNPVSVYIHRINVVVVLGKDDGVEEGLYIYVPISSYFPQDGDDGFTFAHLGDNVYKYTREPELDTPDLELYKERHSKDKRVLSGTVIDEYSNPVANAKVFASYAQHGRTDKNGTFSLLVPPVDSSGSIGPLDFPMFVWAFRDDEPYRVAWTLIRHPASADLQYRRMLGRDSIAHTEEEWEQKEQRKLQYPLIEETHQGVKLVIEDEDDLVRSIPGDPGEFFGDIADDPKVRDIALVMVPASIITGRIANASGQPIANATVQIGVIEMQLGTSSLIIGDLDHDWKAEAFAVTDEHGYYRLQNLPMSWKNLHLRAEADGYCSDEREFRNEGQNIVKGCDFQLMQGESDDDLGSILSPQIE